MEKLRERILEYRAKHDMSQEDFANACQLNVMTVNAIENGKGSPSKLTVMKIELVLRKDENND